MKRSTAARSTPSRKSHPAGRTNKRPSSSDTTSGGRETTRRLTFSDHCSWVRERVKGERGREESEMRVQGESAERVGNPAKVHRLLFDFDLPSLLFFHFFDHQVALPVLGWPSLCPGVLYGARPADGRRPLRPSFTPAAARSRRRAHQQHPRPTRRRSSPRPSLRPSSA